MTWTIPSKQTGNYYQRKLLPKFSAPQRVVSRNQNSYQLETSEGFPIAGKFSSRQLQQFIPRQGTELDRTQVAIEREWQRREEKENDLSSTTKVLNLDTTVKKGTIADSGEKHAESEETSHTTGPISLDTRPGGSHSHATRMLLSPGGYMWLWTPP